MANDTALDGLITRDRLWVASGAVIITAVSWTYLVRIARDMASMESMNMTTLGDALVTVRATPWTSIDVAMMFVMWTVMMVAMMLPSATPMLLIFAMVNRRRSARGRTAASPALFASVQPGGNRPAMGAPFCRPTLADDGDHERGAGRRHTVVAGVYQWTPVKTSCLQHCQSPIQFVSAHWRDGQWGAFRMGWHHGRYCLGCCWILMCLLFVGGVMNLLWIAALALFVLVEKLCWYHRWIPAVSGTMLVAWGVLVLVEEL